MSVLHGNLEVFALPDVFRLLARNRVEGALRVVRQSGDGVVYFREGEVYYALSSLTREFLGQRLVNAKLITQGQLLRILDEQKKSGNRRLGDLLVEKGFISKELLETFLREQIQDAIFDLLQWDVGEFTFDVGENAPQEVGLSISAENLIMESSRRVEEWEVIKRKIPSMDVVVRMAPTPPEDAMEINIKPEEWTLLVLADGTRTVREIAAAGERSEFDAGRILYGLVTAGLLDVGSSAAAVAPQVGGRRPLVATPEPSPPEERVEVPEPAPTEPEKAAAPQAMKRTSGSLAVERVEEGIGARADEPHARADAERVEAEPPVAADTPSSQPEAPVQEPAQEVPEPAQEVPEPAQEVPEPRPQPVGSAAFGGNGSDSRRVAPRKPDRGISKELLLRLIDGVRNL